MRGHGVMKRRGADFVPLVTGSREMLARRASMMPIAVEGSVTIRSVPSYARPTRIIDVFVSRGRHVRLLLRLDLLLKLSQLFASKSVLFLGPALRFSGIELSLRTREAGQRVAVNGTEPDFQHRSPARLIGIENSAVGLRAFVDMRIRRKRFGECE
jgi:hypothetical protein